MSWLFLFLSSIWSGWVHNDGFFWRSVRLFFSFLTWLLWRRTSFFFFSACLLAGLLCFASHTWRDYCWVIAFFLKTCDYFFFSLDCLEGRIPFFFFLPACRTSSVLSNVWRDESLKIDFYYYRKWKLWMFVHTSVETVPKLVAIGYKRGSNVAKQALVEHW